MSSNCPKSANKYGIEIGGVNKLVPNFGNKSKYVLYCKNLQLYLSLGTKLINFHRVLKFKQSDYLKKYTDFNTGKRKNAADSFVKYFFKLMNISVYGNTMENLRRRVKVRLVNNAGHYKKNGLADQVLLHRKYLIKTLLLSMKLN